MKTHEKIKLLRDTHHLTQEEMAEKLSMSTNGYAKMERGVTNIQVDKLEQIANVFNMDLLELMSLGERKLVYCSIGDNNNGVLIGVTEDSGAFATAQLQATIDHQAEIIIHQKEELQMLKEMVELLKQK